MLFCFLPIFSSSVHSVFVKAQSADQWGYQQLKLFSGAQCLFTDPFAAGREEKTTALYAICGDDPAAGLVQRMDFDHEVYI